MRTILVTTFEEKGKGYLITLHGELAEKFAKETDIQAQVLSLTEIIVKHNNNQRLSDITVKTIEYDDRVDLP